MRSAMPRHRMGPERQRQNCFSKPDSGGNGALRKQSSTRRKPGERGFACRRAAVETAGKVQGTSYRNKQGR